MLVLVWGIHFFLLAALLINHLWTRSKPLIRPIAVRTVTPIVEGKKSAPLPAVKKTTIKAAKPQATQPKAPSKPKPKTDKGALRELTSALEQLKALEKPKTSEPLSLPSAIFIEPKGQVSTAMQSYGSALIAYLENQLDLPEFGVVRVELCLNRDGHLLKSLVVASESEKNSEFLKNRLPELAFPCFNDFQIRENTLTFTVSFRNAETF